MAELPTGTVTFLFTDIEGSTQLWEQHPEAMQAALSRHDAFLRAAIEANGGHVFKTMGDAFCAAFPRATDAIQAAIAIQQHLSTLRPPASPSAAELPLKVRIALHAGIAEVRDDDYFGPMLNRVTRLLAVSHGGQVILSQTTCDLAQGDLPPETSLRDLGWHRLRYLLRPEHVYQLLHPALPVDFPPLNSLSLLSNNLPQQVTRFIGREREIAHLKPSLETTRLLTLTGTGGTGKTRLAVQIASELLSAYEDGVWLVELASLTDPALVTSAVAEALQVQEEVGKPLPQALTESLKEKELLLVLDNCEHLLDASARLVERLIQSCAKVRILATSRERLGLPGEQIYHVPSLSVPELGEPSPTPESLAQSDAVRLFLDRAALARPSFALTPQNALHVAQVCHRLGGIPLAIELAAFRLNHLSVQQIAEHMDDRFRLLTAGSRTALPRHQTLRALLDWSYDLLSEDERALLRRLSLFAGGFTLEAAEAVCAGEGVGHETMGPRDAAWDAMPDAQGLTPPLDEERILDLLGQLIDKSLVLAGDGDETRYQMLETIRHYAWEKLCGAAEGSVIRERTRDWFLAQAELAVAELERPDRAIWFGRLVVEFENLRAALGGPFPRSPGARSPGAGDIPVGPARLERWDRVINRLVPAYRHLGRAEAAHAILEEYMKVCEAEGYALGFARALTLMAVFLRLHQAQGDASRAMFEQAIAVCEAHGLHDWSIYPRCRLAEHLALEGTDLERAEELIRACSRQAEVRHDVQWLAGPRPTMASRIDSTLMWIATHRADWEALKRAFQASLEFGGTFGISLRLMLDKIEETCHQRGGEAQFRDLCHFLAKEYERAGLEAPLQQWYLEPACPASRPGELWIEECFDGESWHQALRWQDATGRSRIDRATRPGWLGVSPAGGTNLWPETDLNAPRLVAEVQGAFAAQTRVELESGTHVLAGLLVWGGEQHFARLEIQSLPTHPERASIQLAACVGGRFQQIGRGQCEQQPTWLRFDRVGDELVGWCSEDGERWLACGRVRLPQAATEHVGLATIPYGAGSRAWFDTFLLWRGTGRKPQ